MKKQWIRHLFLLSAVFLLGTAAIGLLFRFDNKYTAALPGGDGYNVLPAQSDGVSFLVDGWEVYPGQLLEPSHWETGSPSKPQHTYIGQ